MNERKPPVIANMDQIYLRALDELARPYPSIKLPGWNLFNDYTGGLRSREFTILCGPTGSGKTQWLACLSTMLLTAKVKHFVASIETGPVDYMMRVMSVLNGEDLNTGDAIPVGVLADITARYAGYFTSRKIEYSLYDNRVPVEVLIGQLTYMANQGCQVAIVDNLNFLLEVVRSSDTIVEMDRVVHELIMFCKRTEMHLILVMHPKKTEGGRVESEFDIKGSSTAVQEAQNVLLLNRLRKEDLQGSGRSPFQRELKIAKMRRRGRFVGRTIRYDFVGAGYVESSGV